MRVWGFRIFFLLVLASCSNSYNPIEIYEVILPRTEVSKVVDIPLTPINIRLEPVVDARASVPVAILDDKQLSSKSDLSEVVTSSITRTLQTAGFRSSSAGSVVLLGEIKKFFATFQGNFPSEGEAEVVLSLVVKNAENRTTYSAQYQGTAKIQTILASPNDVSEALESALESALRQMLKDRSMLSFLRSGGMRSAFGRSRMN